MKKGVGFILFTFIGLVVLNWLFLVAGSFLPPFPNNSLGVPTFTAHGEDGLASIDLTLFTKNSVGRTYITQGYGRTPYSYMYPNDWHDGIDIAAVYGAPIYSPTTGVVIAVGNQDNYCYHKAFGKYIAIQDTVNNLVIWYAHLGTQRVTPGTVVEKGEALGTVGATGLETGTHLHLSIFKAQSFAMSSTGSCGPMPTGQDVNPLNYIGTTYN